MVDGGREEMGWGGVCDVAAAGGTLGGEQPGLLK